MARTVLFTPSFLLSIVVGLPSLVPRGDLRLDGGIAGDAHADVGSDVSGVADIPRAALIGDGCS